MRTNWNGKPYHSLDFYLKETFGKKVYRLSLDGGMTCPNRDGTLGTRGCIFCSEGGSGEFAVRRCASLKEQAEAARQKVARKLPASGAGYILYFQSYTNTYAPLPVLRSLFTEAVCLPDVCAVSVATRPDCLPPETIRLLKELGQIRPFWVELGLQTMHEETARFIRRGYDLPVFEDAFFRLREAGIPVIVHVILGLPHETREDMLATIRYLARLRPDGIKLQLLHVLKGTDLLPLYRQGAFSTLEFEEYLQLTGDCLALLPQETVIHRLSGDGPRNLLAAPMWSADKKRVLNGLHRYLKEQGIYQGMAFVPSCPRN